MSHFHNPSRRLFIRQATALGTMGAAAPLAFNLAAMSSASAAAATDYKAIVCIFLHGGNDHFNTVLATNGTQWSNYQVLRNQAPDSIALLQSVAANLNAPVGSPAWLGGVLPITPTNSQGNTYGLHPRLTNLAQLFNTQKRLAILSNIGTLIEPTSKAAIDAGTARLPNPLYSHNDQQSQWQAMASEGASRGWGGRMADMFAANNGQSMFTAISTAGNAVWLAGNGVKQYSLAPSGAISMGLSKLSNGDDVLFGSRLGATVFKRTLTQASVAHPMMRDIAVINQSSMAAEATINGALPAADAAPYGPESAMNYTSLISGTTKSNPLAQQLRAVARMIAAGPSLGLKRQVFFVSLPGFDTHAEQNKRHAELMTMLDHGMAYFDRVLNDPRLNMSDKVTAFTASDFGRTFTSNGDGTDHGWGSHHFVMGAAVKGGDIHGTFPTLGVKNANNNGFDSLDQLYNGALLPKQSVVQLGATLGKWFGLSPSELLDVFPQLSNFGSRTDLGFMKA